MAAAYGLVNENAKRRVHTGATLLSFSLITSSFISQLFVKLNGLGAVLFIIIKIIGYLLAAGSYHELRSFFKHISKTTHS